MIRFALLFCGLFLLLISTYFVSRFTIQTGAQSINSTNSTEVVDESEISISGNKAYGSIFPLKYNGENLRDFTLSQPLPEIWMVTIDPETANFEKNGKFEITPNAQKVLYQHWIKALEFRYITEIAKRSEDINYNAEDGKLINSTLKTENLLLKTPITTEDGSRNISANEASQLLVLIGEKADEVIIEIMKYK